MFKNKVVLITGATSGIGEETAKAFAKEGASVVLVGRNKEKGLHIEQEILSSNGKAIFIPCDVSNDQEVQKMVTKAIDTFGKIDILFNNAGTMLPSMEIERMPIADWQKTFDTNLLSMFLVTRYAKPYIIAQKGTIINNASIAGLQHYAAGRSYAYSASKAAVIQFSHQMAKNYAPEGVRVNCICPGIIQTPILHGRDPKIYESRIPLGYVGTPQDVAKVVVFLASENASYITGAVIPVDGGVTL